MTIAGMLDKAMHNFYGTGKRLSQAELSRMSKVPQPTISRILKGTSIPETATLKKLAKALRIPFHKLAGEDHGEQQPTRRISATEQHIADIEQLSKDERILISAFRVAGGETKALWIAGARVVLDKAEKGNAQTKRAANGN